MTKSLWMWHRFFLTWRLLFKTKIIHQLCNCFVDRFVDQFVHRFYHIINTRANEKPKMMMQVTIHIPAENNWLRWDWLTAPQVIDQPEQILLPTVWFSNTRSLPPLAFSRSPNCILFLWLDVDGGINGSLRWFSSSYRKNDVIRRVFTV